MTGSHHLAHSDDGDVHLEDFEELSQDDSDNDADSHSDNQNRKSHHIAEAQVVDTVPSVTIVKGRSEEQKNNTMEKDKNSFSRLLHRNLEQFMESITPDMTTVDRNDLRKYGLKYILSITYYLAFIIAFTWLYYWSFNKAINSIYLAPTSEDPPDNCEVKSVILSGKYYIDSNGYWEGSKEYDMAKRLYILEFIRVSMSMEDYVRMVRKFQREVKYVNDVAYSRDLTFSKVVWSSFKSRYYHSKGTVDFYLNGDAKYLLKMKVFRSYFAGPGKVCIPSGMTATYNPQAASYDINFQNSFSSDYDSWISSKSNESRIKVFQEPCPNLFLLNGDLTSDPAEVTTLRFDARTIMTSIAVNYNLTKTSTLVKVGSHRNFSLEFYVDNTYYEDMDPIVCLKTSSMCGMVIGNQILIPYLVSQGVDNPDRKCAFDYYKRCGTRACREEFYFMNSLLVFVFVPFSDLNEVNTPKGPKIPEDPIADLIDYDYSDYYYAEDQKDAKKSTLDVLRDIMSNLRSKGYDAALDTVYAAADASYFPVYYANLFKSSSNQHDASYWLRNLSRSCPGHDYHAQMVNQLCLGENCTLLVLATSHEKDFFTTSAGLRINAFGNSWKGKQESIPWWDISIYDEAVFEQMAKTPPVDLFESVMQCRKAYSQAAIDILGITFSITRLLSTLFYSITIAVVVFVYNNYIVKKTGVRKVVKRPQKERRIRQLMVNILSKVAKKDGNKDVNAWVDELEELCDQSGANGKVAPDDSEMNNYDSAGNYVSPTVMFS